MKRNYTQEQMTRKKEATSNGCAKRGNVQWKCWTWSPEKMRTFTSFIKAHYRCEDPDQHNYEYYGGRGIKVCDEWSRTPAGFENFCKSMGLRPEGLSIDRIDNDGDYEPKNCKWSTRAEQSRNRRCCHAKAA